MTRAKAIRVIDQDFNLLAEIEDYNSYMLTRSWSRVGEFQLLINFNKENVDSLQKGNIIFGGTDYHKAGLIQHVEHRLDQSGALGEIVLVRGYTLEGLAKRRITIPPAGADNESYTDQSHEHIMKDLLAKQLVNPIDPSRKINWLAIAPNLERGSLIDFTSRYRDLSDELEKLSLLSDLGWGMTLDFASKKAIFDVYEGMDRTVGSGNPHVIFSTEFDNMKAQSFIDSDFNYANTAIIGGQEEGADREIMIIGGESGANRFETFVDARDVGEEDQLPQRGQERLNELSGELSFEGEILANSNVSYEEDYDLGDIVTVRNKKWNVTLNTRITEITEVYERTGYQVNATFGSMSPTFTDAVRKTIIGMNSEAYR